MPVNIESENTPGKIEVFNTPILLIIFNRPDTTRKVFEVIRQQRPKHLFVSADGPRPGNIEDIEKCRVTREVIQIDWECELKTVYRNDNLGCGRGPVNAITWFFNSVEKGIILEDDVLPHPDFFPYCEELLYKYKDDDRVSMIGGLNFLNHWKNSKESYFFSSTGATPGWASWKRVWKNFDYQISAWEKIDGREKIKVLINNEAVYNYYSNIFSEIAFCPKNDVWDYQWLFTRMISGYSVVPVVNLISNIGFGEDATHTNIPDSIHSKLVLHKFNFPIVHKIDVKVDRFFDWLVFESCINPQKKTIFKKALLYILKSVFTER